MSYEIPNEWVDAVNQGDVDRIMKCYDDNASLLATFAADPIRTREGIRLTSMALPQGKEQE